MLGSGTPKIHIITNNDSKGQDSVYSELCQHLTNKTLICQKMICRSVALPWVALTWCRDRSMVLLEVAQHQDMAVIWCWLLGVALTWGSGWQAGLMQHPPVCICGSGPARRHRCHSRRGPRSRRSSGRCSRTQCRPCLGQVDRDGIQL